jgi:tetratricopeptide (TPR) repeat protein
MVKGDLFVKTGRYEEAIETYDKATNAFPNDSKLWLEKSKRFRRLKYHRQALECCDKAIEINPLESEAYDFKALILWRLQKLEGNRSFSPPLLR